jgi:hypothetical protein
LKKEELQDVITLVRDKQDEQARARLVEILKRDKTDDTAWVWMACVAETPKLRRKCLEEALKHNPRNKTARKALENMEEPETTVAVESRHVSTQTDKLPGIAHILCGWPLLLVAVGGMIGGALGGRLRYQYRLLQIEYARHFQDHPQYHCGERCYRVMDSHRSVASITVEILSAKV